MLFFIELKSRRAHIAGVTANPIDVFMGQATEGSLPFLQSCRYLIHDRDTKYSLRFRMVLEAAGIELIRTPFQAPNANAYAERFVRSIKEECLGRMILFGEGHLKRALDQYVVQHHAERNHQGPGNELIEGASVASGEGAPRACPMVSAGARSLLVKLAPRRGAAVLLPHVGPRSL